MLSQYRVDYDNNTSEMFVAENMKAVVNVKENATHNIAQLTRVAVAIGVETPTRMVKFVVKVTPDQALSAGCKGVPDTWVVPEGTKVIFTALPAAGFNFDGWRASDGTLLSGDAKFETQIAYPADPADLALEIEARFIVIPTP
jgi:hypothetical protein